MRDERHGYFSQDGAYADSMVELPGEAWKDRSEPTPKGNPIWATSGETVWLIMGDGKPIDPRATLVRAWTEALIPKPPKIDDRAAGTRGGERGK